MQLLLCVTCGQTLISVLSPNFCEIELASCF